MNASLSQNLDVTTTQVFDHFGYPTLQRIFDKAFECFSLLTLHYSRIALELRQTGLTPLTIHTVSQDLLGGYIPRVTRVGPSKILKGLTVALTSAGLSRTAANSSDAKKPSRAVWS